ncbi:MAG: hypothetical protein HYZ25_04350 [Chloroflexi bacterium]|nr:hypothetical protein [Chloroflexota bacterium]
MQNNRLGCLTSTGIVAALVTIAAILGFAFFNGNQMFSPGPLNAQAGEETLGGVTSHAQIRDCSACHAGLRPSDHMADHCVTCHTEIAAQMMDVAKLHGSITKKSPALACRDCHPDHRGSTAALTELGSNAFPHEALGFSLAAHPRTSAGQPFTCADCHPGDITAFTASTCEDCHRQMDSVFSQAHTISYGTACLDCHDGVDRFGKAFSHAGFSFKTEGGHAGVACAKCHTDARSLADFPKAPTDCYSCHRVDDEHGGQFGTDCAACHNPSRWDDATFDHSRSNFPLTGAHVNVKCEQCHTNGQFKGLASTCVSCHAEPTQHMGQFGTDCAACHSTNAWKPASFNGKHTFPLNHGESGQVSCTTCHPVSYNAYTCYGCHEHNEAEIASKHREEGISDFQDCVRCHADGREHDD